jgi:alpha-aminoadipate carrier protein LysW
MVNCPSCDAVIDVDQEDLDEGESLTCDECGSTLNVVSLDPLELEVEDAEDEDEDEDEDEVEDLDYDEDEDDEEDDEEEDEEE